MEIGGRHIKDVDSVGEDEDCVEGYKRRTILNEGHITRDTDATRRRIIAVITFMLRTITQKNILNRLCRQLGTFTRSKQNIACTSKNSEMVIVRRSAKKYLTGTFIRQLG